jgi:hypothetical protein
MAITAGVKLGPTGGGGGGVSGPFLQWLLFSNCGHSFANDRTTVPRFSGQKAQVSLVAGQPFAATSVCDRVCSV